MDRCRLFVVGVILSNRNEKINLDYCYRVLKRGGVSIIVVKIFTPRIAYCDIPEIHYFVYIAILEETNP